MNSKKKKTLTVEEFCKLLGVDMKLLYFNDLINLAHENGYELKLRILK